MVFLSQRNRTSFAAGIVYNTDSCSTAVYERGELPALPVQSSIDRITS